MAEGLPPHYAGERFAVESAGTTASFVRPEAIAVMRELGIDISAHCSKSIDEFEGQQFDYVITSATMPAKLARYSSARRKGFTAILKTRGSNRLKGREAYRVPACTGQLRADLRDFSNQVA
jgi:protein-tyrosine-phosphatase